MLRASKRRAAKPAKEPEPTETAGAREQPTMPDETDEPIKARAGAPAKQNVRRSFSWEQWRTPYTIWRILSVFATLLLAGGTVVGTWLMRESITTIINDTNTIQILSSDLQVHTINANTYTQAKERLEQKLPLPLPPVPSRNLFLYGPINSTTTTSSTP